MALTDSNEHSDKKSDGHNKGSEKKEKLLTKVVIRRLPPTMDQDTFLNQISPVPPYDYLYMVKGDASLGENSFARAYINFTNPNDIYDFKEKFDNYVFLDSAGHEYPAVVEFAAFQKIPKRRNKVRVDPKVGSIEVDQYYQEFVEMINKPPEPDEKPEYSYQINTETNNKNETMTPLLEFIKNKRAEKIRIREERREERKRKEFERKKFREDERKKRFEEKSPIKSNKSQYSKVVSPKENKNAEKDDKPDTEEAKMTEEKTEKEEAEKYEKPPPTSSYKGKDKKYEDRKKDLKPKYTPRKDYIDKREYKSRREDYKDRDYRSKYDDYKKEDPKNYQQKKVKKYSEKREERKMEAQKAEQKKLEQQQQESSTKSEESPKSTVAEEKQKNSSTQREEKSFKDSLKESPTEKDSNRLEKETRSSSDGQQRRIRNKDRPTIAIYRPGMLSKRKQVEGETDNKDTKKE